MTIFTVINIMIYLMGGMVALTFILLGFTLATKDVSPFSSLAKHLHDYFLNRQVFRAFTWLIVFVLCLSFWVFAIKHDLFYESLGLISFLLVVTFLPGLIKEELKNLNSNGGNK